MSYYNANQSLEYLDTNYHFGVFQPAEKFAPLLWVLQGSQPMVVQLRASETRPAFSYRYGLHTPKDLKGVFLGKTELTLGKPARGKTFINQCGIIIHSGHRIYLKAAFPKGKSQRILILPFRSKLYERKSIFYPDWSLRHTEFENIIYFESYATPPPTRLTFNY